MKKHKITFNKGLGQNFITDDTICPRMAEYIALRQDASFGVIEIGAGVGVLTKELLKVADKVVCIELDSRLFPLLHETLTETEKLRLINADILKTDLNKVIDENFGEMDVYVCANLPYYITSPVILKLLEDNLAIKGIVVMVQKEAGDRLTAEVGSRDSGAVTVAVNCYAKAEKLFDVDRTCFVPSPKVDSCVISLDLSEKKEYDISDRDLFFKMVKAAFGQRRKTITNSLSNGLGLSKDCICDAVRAIGKDPSIRAETLTMDELVNLSNTLSEKKG
ncbi:MAG: 16S rRNA (adenine(1518)-N(6)/adenine(1519)-N(6))-dimethyltransferase RsmA [Clostridiales bacterium]|nr:16S rRNA (adenine(1518)-N(6)/adenine(1519)-N(6))-dimethyltransferase RsmA [Clostridiales bacterium]